MSKSTKTQLTAKQLQAKLDLLKYSGTAEQLTLSEVSELLEDPRCTKKQLSRVLMAITFHNIGTDGDMGCNIVQTIRHRADFESLIEDFEFESRFARACAIML